jgi:decaprenylphospho-beta-D-erythro-pentofuranosid-2-ulose 2-reductase
MLVNKKEFNEVVLVGSTSDIGISIVNNIRLSNEAKLHVIGRAIPDKGKFKNQSAKIIFYKCDLSNVAEVREFLTQLYKFKDVDVTLIAAGFLPNENTEFNLDNIQESMQVNSVSSIMFLSSFVNLMKENIGGRILVCSSVASIRPRIRNFTYGASKSALDFYTVGLQNKLKKSTVSISLLRPGYVYTKMTKNFAPAPFAIDIDIVGKIASSGLVKRKKVIYAPAKLRIIMNALRLVPRFIFNRLG